jgi:hypothetical protein
MESFFANKEAIMTRAWRVCADAAIALAVAVSLAAPLAAQQNPCDQEGPGCRPLTKAEIAALKDRLMGLKAALPVPDPARWAVPADVGTAYTMSFVAELEAGGAMTSQSWPAGAFTERNDVHYVYDGVKKGEAKPKDTKDPLAAAAAMQEAFGNRIEILAMLLPHAYLVEKIDGKCVDVSDPEATDIEKTPTFLAWMANDGTVLTMIFGPRTCKEEETERLEKPAPTLAPVKCVTLEITGPDRAAVMELKKKVDRKAFEALLGPLAK